MSFDWAVYSEISPDSYTKNYDGARQKINPEGSQIEIDYGHVTAWGAICKQMAEDLENGVKDQQEYIIEIEKLDNEIETEQKETENKVEKLNSEIEELRQKEENGSITEEEKKELETKSSEVSQLTTGSESACEKINAEEDSLKTKAISTEEKVKTANEWSSKTLEAAENVLTSDVLEEAESHSSMSHTENGVTTSWSYTQGAELAQERGENLQEITEKYSKNENFFKTK